LSVFLATSYEAEQASRQQRGANEPEGVRSVGVTKLARRSDSDDMGEASAAHLIYCGRDRRTFERKAREARKPQNDAIFFATFAGFAFFFVISVSRA